MKYLVVTEYFFEDTPGGSGRVAWDIALMMRDCGHDVTMLVYRQEQSHAADEIYQNIKILRFDKKILPACHPGRLSAIIESARLAALQLFENVSWDVVHIHTPLIGAGVMRALGESQRYIVTTHSPIVAENEIIWRAQGFTGAIKLLLGRPALRRIEKEVLCKAEKIHTLSRYTKEIINNAYGVGPKVAVIPHWFDASPISIDKQQARKKLGWPLEKKILFTVRGMRPRYGIDIAIEAASKIINDRRDTCFYIGGSGPMRPQLEILAATRCPAGEIQFVGRLSDEDLELAYIAADLFILPTLALECYGLIIVEAMAHGCAVVSSDAGAIPEIMNRVMPENVTRAGDVEQLQSAMTRNLQAHITEVERNKLLTFVEENFSKRVVGEKLLELFT